MDIRIYEAQNGRFILWNGETKTFFDTEAEANMALSKHDWITRHREMISKLISAINDYHEVRSHYDALNFTETLSNGDFIGENAGITAAELKDSLASAAAFAALFTQGHNTNLYKVCK